ncbi:unnamed protein product [Mytilus coruscus]|uniref:Uncharacterized protein n=1 Tax=Mytilus coruscus TaxID=42192 RepID=A0A6J8C446_MYTCO|nr:unnamed protein product [Mytilus coruscus]
MQNQLELETVSVRLNKYLCEEVVGSENIVRYRRLYYKLHDDILSDIHREFISSGSKTEGFALLKKAEKSSFPCCPTITADGNLISNSDFLKLIWSDFQIGQEVNYKLHDDMLYNRDYECISSGSRAEGLDLPGSNFDFMLLLKLWEIYKDKHKDKEDVLMLYKENSLPGFALLKKADS